MSAIEPYLKCEFEVSPREPWSDLIIADLGGFDFETFEEQEKGFDAYIRKSAFDAKKLEELLHAYAGNCKVNMQQTEIAPVNWNEKWEQGFEPVIVDDRCVVKAPFHELSQKYPYSITLTPKMAFGTGHHQTTFLMIRDMLKMDMKGKSVLDMGCGTAVLAILAAMQGASSVLAIDTDEWAYENSLENIAINHTPQVIVEKGDASRLEGHSFNIILANINKNVLLEDIKHYASCLDKGGCLLLSGFFENDMEDIDNESLKYHFEKVGFDVLGNWTQVQYVKY